MCDRLKIEKKVKNVLCARAHSDNIEKWKINGSVMCVMGGM